MNTIFEQIGGTYAEKEGYLYPSIAIPEEDMQPIGKYGRMRKRYLKEHRPVLYSQLIVSGKLFSHLREIDSACNDRMELLISQMVTIHSSTVQTTKNNRKTKGTKRKKGAHVELER